MRASQWLGLAVLAATVGLATWLRLPLAHEGLWRDEAIALEVARAPTLRDLLDRNERLDSNPPLFYLTLRAAGAAGGAGDRVWKGLALAWGLAAVIAAGWLGKEMFGRTAGAIAAFLAACQPLLIRMAGEVRSYSMASALTAASLALAVRALRREGPGGASAARILGLATLFTLAAYSHYTATLVVGIVGLTAIAARFRSMDRKSWDELLFGSLIAGAAFLPWLPVFWRHAHVGLPWDLPRNPWERLGDLGGMLPEILPLFVASIGPAWSFVAAAGTLLLALGGLVASRRTKQPAAWWRGVFLVAFSAAGIFVVFGNLAHFTRYLSITALLLCALAGGWIEGIATTNGRFRIARCAGIAIALFFSAFLPAAIEHARRMEPENDGVVRSGAQTLCRERFLSAGELVVVAPDYFAPTLRYYCGDAVRMRGYLQWENPELPNVARYHSLLEKERGPAAALDRIASEVAPRGSGFWLAWADGPPLVAYPGLVADLRRALAERFGEGETKTYPGRLETINLTRYEAAAPRTARGKGGTAR